MEELSEHLYDIDTDIEIPWGPKPHTDALGAIDSVYIGNADKIFDQIQCVFSLTLVL